MHYHNARRVRELKGFLKETAQTFPTVFNTSTSTETIDLHAQKTKMRINYAYIYGIGPL